MKYYTQARLFPTIITSVPLLIVVQIAVSRYDNRLSGIFSLLPIITKTAFYGALVYLFVQVNRFVAKELFQKFFFSDDLHMPTTNRLLWSDKYFEQQDKTRIRNKIIFTYQVDLPTKEEEIADELATRRRIAFAVSQIRIDLRNSQLLLQHNIEYGFFRNLLGGSVLAVVVSIGLIIYATTTDILWLKQVSLLLIGIYLVPIVFSKLIIKRYSNYYSKIFYEEFINM